MNNSAAGKAGGR
jgi:hypothetical protein